MKGQYPGIYLLGALESASSLSMFPFVPVLLSELSDKKGWGSTHPTALAPAPAVIPLLCQCCFAQEPPAAVLGPDGKGQLCSREDGGGRGGKGAGQGLWINSRNTSWVWNKAVVLSKFQICQQIFTLLTNPKLGMEEELQFSSSQHWGYFEWSVNNWNSLVLVPLCCYKVSSVGACWA